MQNIGTVALIGASLLLGGSAYGETLSIDTINAAQWSKPAAKTHLSPAVLKAQVLLDRAGFSPGVIDGRGGENFAKALAEFQRRHGLGANGTLDEATFAALTATSAEPVVTEYEIAAADVKGPFIEKIPRDFEKMAELARLTYRSPRELLAEKFHMSEPLLRTLNPKKALERAGTTIVVTNVGTRDPHGRKGKDGNTGSIQGEAAKRLAKAARVEVRKRERAVRAFAEDGALVGFYPASVGSKEKPAPSGTFEVRAVAENPTYRYNPEYAFKGQKATEPVEIAPGPNNPVGVVWIALSVEGYGIHGTPDPERVSKSYSNGCVRLTNWDALALAKLVRKGMPVEFVD